MEKPRGFSLHFWDETGDGDMNCDVDPMPVKLTGDTFKVIEYAAYEKAVAALKEYARGICHGCAAEHGAPDQAFTLPDTSGDLAERTLRELGELLEKGK